MWHGGIEKAPQGNQRASIRCHRHVGKESAAWFVVVNDCEEEAVARNNWAGSEFTPEGRHTQKRAFQVPDYSPEEGVAFSLSA